MSVRRNESMSAKSKSKAKETQAEKDDDDHRASLAEGILRPDPQAHGPSEVSITSFQILPEYLQKWVASSEPLPSISTLSLPNIYPILAHLLGVDDYVYNMHSFWLVDIVGEAIRIAQDELHLSTGGQKLMVAWFINILRAIKERNLTREEVYAEVSLTMVTDEICVSHTALGVPTPMGCCESKGHNPLTHRTTRSFQSVEMYSIVGLLWHIFANPFQYEVIKKAFCDTPPVQDINIPYHINLPKQYKPPPVPEKKKSAKDKKKGKKAGEEVLREKQMAMLEKNERERNLYILPLKEAVDINYFRDMFNVQEIPERPAKPDKKKRK